MINIKCPMGCVHFNGERTKQGKPKCKAFPSGIPRRFILGETKHNSVIKGQVGRYVYAKENRKNVLNGAGLVEWNEALEAVNSEE